jgi:hypothetical protein
LFTSLVVFHLLFSVELKDQIQKFGTEIAQV